MLLKRDLLTRIFIPLHGAEICGQKNKVLHMVYVHTDGYFKLFRVKQKQILFSYLLGRYNLQAVGQRVAVAG